MELAGSLGVLMEMETTGVAVVKMYPMSMTGKTWLSLSVCAATLRTLLTIWLPWIEITIWTWVATEKPILAVATDPSFQLVMVHDNL
jgi:hypothetical protein